MIACLLAYLYLVYLYSTLYYAWPQDKVPLKADCRYDVDTITRPIISIVIALKNEAHNLHDLVESLALQTLPGYLYEVILVDDRSIDDTYGQGLLFVNDQHRGIRFRILTNQYAPGKKGSQRTGIADANGTYILTTDADCRPAPGWMQAIYDTLQAQPSDLLILPIRLGGTGGGYAAGQGLQAAEFAALMGSTAAYARAGHAIMCNGANLTFTKELYIRAEAIRTDHDLASGDDIFLLQAAHRLGVRISYTDSPTLWMPTKPVTGVRAYLQQRIRWAAKSTQYTDRLTQAVALFTVAAQVAFWSLFLQSNLVIPVLFWLTKGTLEAALIIRQGQKAGQQIGIIWVIVWQVLYLPYVLVVAVLSLIKAGRGGLGQWR